MTTKIALVLLHWFSRSFLFKTAAPAGVLLLWFLSSQATLPAPENILGFDKIAHFCAYAVLAAAFGFWIRLESWQKHGLRSLVIAAGSASLYGIIDELHQAFIPGRDSCIFDWMADTAGALVGAALLYSVLLRAFKAAARSEA